MDKKENVSPEKDDQERRCPCGQLLARLSFKGVELKCKRCKRMHTISWKDALSLA